MFSVFFKLNFILNSREYFFKKKKKCLDMPNTYKKIDKFDFTSDNDF